VGLSPGFTGRAILANVALADHAERELNAGGPQPKCHGQSGGGPPGGEGISDPGLGR
jgi:hypothetical protein